MLTSLNSTVDYSEPTPLINEPSTILGVVLSFMMLSWICVVLRLYARFWVLRTPGWDDIFVFGYLITTTIGSVMISVSTKYGLGRHFFTLGAEEVKNYLRVFYFANASYTMSTTFIKLSLLFQYLRIFEQGTRVRTICVCTIAFVSVWGFTYTFLAWFPCFPMNGFWDWDVGAKCYGYQDPDPMAFAATYESHTGINMILDLIVLALPVQLYFRPNTHRKTRIYLLFLLGLGVLINVISVWRLVTILETHAAVADVTWLAPISIVLSALEVDIAAVCGCVPVFWPALIAARLDRIFVTKEVEVVLEACQQRGHDEEMRFFDKRSRGSLSHSRDGSASELKQLELSESVIRPPSPTTAKSSPDSGAQSPIMKDGRAAHYHDSFVAALVNPLTERSNNDARVHAQAQSKSRASQNRQPKFLSWTKI